MMCTLYGSEAQSIVKVGSRQIFIFKNSCFQGIAVAKTVEGVKSCHGIMGMGMGSRLILKTRRE